MATRRKPKPKPAPPTLSQCALHEEAIRKLEENHLESHSLLQEIHADIRWIKDGVMVNGSMGLENVMRDQYERTAANSAAIGELKELTHNLKVNKQVRQAMDAWMGAHPTMARMMNTTAKKVGWVILTGAAAYLGIEVL